MKYDNQGIAIIAVDESSDYTWTGTHTFDNNVDFNDIVLIDAPTFTTGAPALQVQANDARIYLRDTGGGTDAKMWGFRADADQLQLSTRSDDDSTGSNWLTVARTTTTPTVVLLPLDNLELRFGTGGDDLAIYHDGTNNHIDSNTGILVFGGNQFSFGSGTNPEITFTGDTNTGLNYVGADDVALMAGGANVVRGNSTGVSFNGATPAARPDYTVTNPSTDRALNVSADTTAQVAAVLGTLIADLIAIGLLQ